MVNALNIINAFEAGQAGKERREQKQLYGKIGNALAGAMPEDYKTGASMAFRAGNLDLGMGLQNQSNLMQTNALAQQEAQQERTMQVLAREAFSLKGLPPEQRAAALQQRAPFITQLTGVDPQMLAGVKDLSDRALDGFISQVQSLDDLIAQNQPFEIGGRLYQRGPDGNYAELLNANEPKAPATGMVPDGQGGWIYDPAYMAGQKELRKAGASNIHVDSGAKTESAYASAIGADLGDQVGEIRSRGEAAASRMGQVEMAESLLAQIDYQGFAGDALLQVQRIGQMLGFDVGDDVSAKEAMQRLSNEMALSLKEQLPGPMSDADRQFLQSIPPNLNVTREGNLALTFMMREKAAFDLAMAESFYAANPQSAAEHQAWERQFREDYGPIFSVEDRQALMRALTGG